MQKYHTMRLRRPAVPGEKRLLVGLTGGLASGKSTVARLLAERSCRVIDADDVVADLYRPGAAGTQAVQELFGDLMLANDGSVHRPLLAARVFKDDSARQQLENLIHPLVQERFHQLTAGASGIVVYEATLLVEAGRANEFDVVVTVEAESEARHQRAVERGMDPEDARRRLEAQGDGARRREVADFVLRNDGSLQELEAAVEDLLDRLHEMLDSLPTTSPRA
ncbi:MAG: dephospho-CoA kinase [Acidobacteriota bacterium]